MSPPHAQLNVGGIKGFHFRQGGFLHETDLFLVLGQQDGQDQPFQVPFGIAFASFDHRGQLVRQDLVGGLFQATPDAPASGTVPAFLESVLEAYGRRRSSSRVAFDAPTSGTVPAFLGSVLEARSRSSLVVSFSSSLIFLLRLRLLLLLLLVMVAATRTAISFSREGSARAWAFVGGSSSLRRLRLCLAVS